MIDTYYDMFCPFPMALLTDFHDSDPIPILKSLEANKPPIILIAGDLIYRNQPDEHHLNIYKNSKRWGLLQGCVGIAPTYMSLGNHEWMLTAEDLEVIASMGVVVLENRWVRVGNTVIGGLSSAFYTEYQAIRSEHPESGLYPVSVLSLSSRKIHPDIEWIADFEQTPGYKILLCHHPEYYPRYLKDRKIYLILSGHAHGGQWRFYDPFHREWRGVYAPGQRFFPALTSGVHDGRLVISCGLSNTAFVPRIHNPEEIVYLLPSTVPFGGFAPHVNCPRGKQ